MHVEGARPGAAPLGPFSHRRSWTLRALGAALWLAAGLLPHTASSAQLQLTWEDNSEGLAAVRIERKTGIDGV